MESEKTENRGGAGRGQGRKLDSELGKKVRVQIMLPQDVADFFANADKSTKHSKVEKLIRKYMMPEKKRI